jgi:hypothetical protein
MPLARQERIHIVILQRNGFSLLPQNAEGAPHGAPSSERVLFFLTLLNPEYQIRQGNLDIF